MLADDEGNHTLTLAYELPDSGRASGARRAALSLSHSNAGGVSG